MFVGIFFVPLVSKMKKNIAIILLLLLTMPLHARRKPVPQLRPDNIDSVLQAMTLREKTLMVTGDGWASLFSGFGIPFTGHPRVKGAAGMTHRIKRLGIPQTVLSDGPAGVRIKPGKGDDGHRLYCTGFPVGTALACTWDTMLVGRVGQALGNEARHYGIDVLLAPGMNIMRHPLCGRNYEYLSEDPLLCGRMAGAIIRGIQSEGVGACAKHFACNNQETCRMTTDALVDTSVLRTMYLRPFEIALREGQPWTVMSSYNLLNGERTQQSRWLLTDVLRQEWGYDGLVVTDWTATRNTRRQIAAGNDMMQPGMFRQRLQLRRAVRRGLLAKEQLDTCVRRVLEYVVRTPSYQGLHYDNHPDLESHAQLCRRAAAEGMVLLKNQDETLPLPTDTTLRIALLGANAYELIAGGTGSGYVNKPYTVSLEQGFQNAGFQLDAKLQTDYHKYVAKDKHRMEGGGFGGWFMSRFMGKGAFAERPLPEQYISDAIARTDVAVVVIGRQAGEGRDRRVEDEFQLTADELDLINNTCVLAHEAGKRVVVVLNVTGVVETASWKHLPDAILCAWCPGQEGGNSMADVLTGRVNPSGRLSMSWPVDVLELPASRHFPTTSVKGDNRQQVRYAEGDSVGYRYYNAAHVEPSYRFGYGLSYTRFEESEPEHLPDGGWIVNVRNVGAKEGAHVVMLFDEQDPMRPLIGFSKTAVLAPGAAQRVVIY